MSLLLTTEDIESLLPGKYHCITRVVYDKNVFIGDLGNEHHILKVIEKKVFDEKKYDKLCQLDHPGLARIYKYYVFDANVIIVRQYIPGLTLNEVLERDGLFLEEQIREVLAKLTLALEYLHTKEDAIIYRDLHPKNIIITPEGEPVLIDIESSRIYKESSSHDTEIIGVIGFIAPEQYGFEQSSIQSDIYSLGIIGAYMLTGKYPTFADNRVNLEMLKGAEDLRFAILKMVEFSKEKRPKSMKRVRFLLYEGRKKKLKGLTIGILIIALICLIGIYLNTKNIEVLEPRNSLETNITEISDLNQNIEMSNETENVDETNQSPADAALLYTSRTYEMFPLLASTSIFEGFDANWIDIDYNFKGDIDTFKIESVSIYNDQQYLYLRYVYEAQVASNTAIFLEVEEVTGVFAKYHGATLVGTNEVVIKLDKSNLKSSIDQFDGEVFGIGYDICEDTCEILTINLQDFYPLLGH